MSEIIVQGESADEEWQFWFFVPSKVEEMYRDRTIQRSRRSTGIAISGGSEVDDTSEPKLDAGKPLHVRRTDGRGYPEESEGC